MSLGAVCCGCLVLAGMLLMGFALRNIPHIDIAKDINHTWSAALRSELCWVRNIHHTFTPVLCTAENDFCMNYSQMSTLKAWRTSTWDQRIPPISDLSFCYGYIADFYLERVITYSLELPTLLHYSSTGRLLGFCLTVFLFALHSWCAKCFYGLRHLSDLYILYM